MLPIKVSKIVCKNLDSRPDRWRECEAEFAKWELDVERVIPEADRNPYRSQCSTTIKILSQAAVDGLDSILILEDDVKFVHLENLIEPPPYTDLYYLGFLPHPAPIASIVGVEGQWLRLRRNCHCSHAIVFYRPIIPYAIDVLERRLALGHYSVDRAWSENLQPTERVYAPNPIVAIQRNSRSDLCRDVYRQHMGDFIVTRYNDSAANNGYKKIPV